MPVFVAVGMIATSVGFGIYTALHQLARAPNVFVKKSKRETIPEVVEPEHVVEETDKFIKKSFFRKVAHVQDSDRHEIMPDPIRGDMFTRYQSCMVLSIFLFFDLMILFFIFFNNLKLWTFLLFFSFLVY